MRYRLKSGSFSRRESGGLRTYRPGEIVKGPVPKAHMDVFESIDPPEEVKQVGPKHALKAVHRSGPWWDVVTEGGDKINDKGLKREEAESMARGE